MLSFLFYAEYFCECFYFIQVTVPVFFVNFRCFCCMGCICDFYFLWFGRVVVFCFVLACCRILGRCLPLVVASVPASAVYVCVVVSSCLIC